MSQFRLSKCPYCGSRRIAVHTVEEWDKPDVTYFECECGAVVQFNTKAGVPVTQSASVQRWNRRAIEL
jgi:lysyl-tRNA synthetase class I